MAKSSDGPAKRHGGLVALTALALSAAIPLAAAAQTGKSERKDSGTGITNAKTKGTEPGRTGSQRRIHASGNTLVILKNEDRRKPTVGIPGRGDKK